MSRKRNLSVKQTAIITVTEHKELPHTKQNIGLDLGIKDLCITSDERKYENPKTIQKYERKLARLQRQLVHKKKGSRNYYKKKKQIARERIICIRFPMRLSAKTK